MRELKFRTPCKCQNGHFRWYYWSVRFGIQVSYWGPRIIDCNCPSDELWEGFDKCGDDEQFTGMYDAKGEADATPIYQGDIISLVIDYDEDGSIIEDSFEIIWSDVYLAFGIKHKTEFVYLCELEQPIVIGNIYENPELNK